MKSKVTAALAIVGGIGLQMGLAPSDAAAAECEIDRPVIFAGLDWDSNRFHVAVARHIAEVGYGCDTDEVPGSSLPLLTGMARGDIDVTMEIWKNNYQDAWDKFEGRGDIAELGVNFPDSVQGWYVPTYLIEGDPDRGIEPKAPDLEHVKDLAKYKELFKDPEQPSKGRFYNCILGWGCEIINTKKLEVYDLGDDFTNFRPGTGAALSAAIASNYERGKAIVAYYWGPTWILGKYDLTLLDEPDYSDECWSELQNEEHPGVACAYPTVAVTVAVNTEFQAQAPKLVEFLSNYRTSNQLVSEALAYMQDNEASTQEAAMHFLRTRKEVWSKWVPDEVAQRIEASLS